jgi:hypothetical protein
MTVSSTLSRQTFACNGTTRAFTLPFRVLASSEVVGYLITIADNSATLLSNGVDFTVSGVGDANAIVTTTAAYGSAFQVRFVRSTNRLQLTDYRDNDPFPAESHEEALDRLTHIAQELGGDVSRAVLFPEPESGQTLPSAAARASKSLAFDEAGNLAVLELADIDGVIGTAFGADQVTTTAGQTVLTLPTVSYVTGTDSVSVFRDGIRIYPGSDYTESSATSITLTSPCTGGREYLIQTGRSVTSGVQGSAVSFTNLGGVARNAHAKLREQPISVSDYTSLQAAITAASTLTNPPEIIVFGTIDVSTTLVVEKAGVTIRGWGSDNFHDAGTPLANARAVLNWTGAPGGTMLEFRSPAGGQMQSGGGCIGVAFKANGSAAVGLSVKSWSGGTFQRLYFDNPTTVGMDVGVIAGSLVEAKDPQNNHFSQCASRHLEVSGGTGGILRLDGDAVANASLNVFEQLDCQFLNGNAYQLNNCDNNLLIRCRAIRAGGGTGYAALLNGSNTFDLTARGNLFIHFSTNGTVPSLSKGTSSFTHPAYNNHFLFLDLDNATPEPTYEPGSTGTWTKANGVQGGSNGGLLGVGLAVGETASTFNQARAALGNSSAAIFNSAENHVVIGDGTNRWSIAIQGSTGDLRINRAAGSGAVNVGNGSPVKINNKLVTEGATDSGGTGFRVLRVPN